MELFGLIKPSVVVADRMSGQVVVSVVLASQSVSKDVIHFPLSIYLASTDVAPAVGLLENPCLFAVGRGPSRRLATKDEFLGTPLLP